MQQTVRSLAASEHDLRVFLRPYRRLTTDSICQTPIDASQVVVWTFKEMWRRAEAKHIPPRPGSWCRAYLKSVVGLDSVQYELAKKDLFSQSDGLNGIYKHRLEDLYAVVYRPATRMSNSSKAAIAGGVALAGMAGMASYYGSRGTGQQTSSSRSDKNSSQVVGTAQTSPTRVGGQASLLDGELHGGKNVSVDEASETPSPDQTPVKLALSERITLDKGKEDRTATQAEKSPPVPGELLGDEVKNPAGDAGEALLTLLFEVEQTGHQMRALITNVVAGGLDMQSYTTNMRRLGAHAHAIGESARTICKQTRNDVCTRIDVYARFLNDASLVPIDQRRIQDLELLKKQKQEGLNKANELMIDSVCILKKNAINVLTRLEFPTKTELFWLTTLIGQNSTKQLDYDEWLKVLLKNDFIKKTAKTYELLFSSELDESLSRLKKQWNENNNLWSDYDHLRRNIDPMGVIKQELCYVKGVVQECSMLGNFKPVQIEDFNFPDTSHNKLVLSQDDHYFLFHLVEDLKEKNFMLDWMSMYRRWRPIWPYFFDDQDNHQINTMISNLERAGASELTLTKSAQDLQRHFKEKYFPEEAVQESPKIKKTSWFRNIF